MAHSRQSMTDDYSPFEDDYRGFDLRDHDDGQRGPLILALAVGILLIFAAVVWNTYRSGIRAESGGIPVVEAPTTPYKVAYQTEPVVPAVDTQQTTLAVTTLEYSDVDRIPVQNAEFLRGGPPQDLRRGIDDEKDVEADEPVTETKPAPIPAPTQPKPRAAAGRTVTPTGLPAPEPTLIPDASSTQVNTAWQTAGNGAYLVQVGAYRTEAAANRAWISLESDLPAIFGTVGRDVQRADLGAKGIFYRLRANAFPTRSDATEFCEALKKSGKSCIVVSR